MVQNKIKGTDLASICLERWFFFLFKRGTGWYNLPKYELYIPFWEEKNDHLNLTSEIFPRTFYGFPSPVGTDLSFLTKRGKLFMIFPSVALPALARATYLLTHPVLPVALGYLPFPYQNSFPAFAKLCASGHATFSLEFLSHWAHLFDPKINTSSVMPS